MNNMNLYEAFRRVPEEAKKTIGGGRLKGMTDINPMWRIKALTEQFGPCGFGWTYTITQQWLSDGASGEIGAFCNIELRVKVDGEWSEPIPGTGGSMYVSEETRGLRTDDEAYKKALTDAISVAAKALGVGADVYWSGDRTKYTQAPAEPEIICERCGSMVKGTVTKDGKKSLTAAHVISISQQKFGASLCCECQRKMAEVAKTRAKAMGELSGTTD